MFGTPVSLLIGLILILGSVGLFFLDKIKPAYARDTDKVYAVFILLAGLTAASFQDIGIGESFHILVMAGMMTTLIIENIRTREPKLSAPSTPFDNRPPRPRYNEAPPVRRGYRAELDNRADPRMDGRAPAGFRGEPTRAPRMAPAQAQYWDNAPRQPYEEYREPAGRLQPSRDAGRDMRGPASQPVGQPMGQPVGQPVNPPLDDRYADGNGRYGERPPARPPVGRPPESMNGRGDDNYAQRPPQRPAADGARPQQGWESDSRQRSAPNGSGADGGNRSSNSDRTLDVRPLSEAPKIDLPTESV